MEEEPEDVEAINDENNESVSSEDEPEINETGIVPEIVRDRNGTRQRLSRLRKPVNPLRTLYQKCPQEGTCDEMILRDLHTLFAVPACNHFFIGKTLHLRLLLELSRITRIKELIQFLTF